MKRILISGIVILSLAFAACNNNKTTSDTGSASLEAQADSLEHEVIEGHDVAMPKSMKIPDLQKEARRLIDSIGKLPAKAQEAAAPFKAKLDLLLQDLSYADVAMNKWMDEFSLDSFKNDAAQRVKYLTEEKIKVDKVKEAVLGSIAKADSLLKAKF